MLMKMIILAVIVTILYCLGSGLVCLFRGNSQGMARSLTWRISLSIALFLFLLLAAWLGWIHPHGISSGLQSASAQLPSQKI